MKDTVEQIKPTAWLIPIERSAFFMYQGLRVFWYRLVTVMTENIRF